jgi:hypothetical protein
VIGKHFMSDSVTGFWMSELPVASRRGESLSFLLPKAANRSTNVAVFGVKALHVLVSRFGVGVGT